MPFDLGPGWEEAFSPRVKEERKEEVPSGKDGELRAAEGGPGH